MKGLLILQVDFMSQIICPKCHERYESDMPRCLWCDAPNPVLNKNISPLPLQKHEVNKFSSLESRHSANNSLENKVHQNKRKLLLFSPLIFILLVLGLFILIYMTDLPFDASVVIFLLCSFVLFMVLLSPFFSEPLKIEENEDSLICHLFYGKKVVSLTGNCDYDIQFFSDGGWVISFRTGLLSVRFSNDAFADLSKIVDKLKDCPNGQKRDDFVIARRASGGIVAVTYKAKFVSYVCLLTCQAVVSIACVVYWIAFIFIEEVFDIYPLYLCLTFFVVLGGYLSWGIPYKIERNGNAFNFFLLGRKAKFSFGKNEFLKYRKGIIMGRVFYFPING